MKINPVIFTDGTKYYKELSDKYIQHKKGLFILAPSGAGKTYFCQAQIENHWIDGDDLWQGADAHPDGPWWKESIEVINRIDMRSDIITMEAVNMGFWIMGASNYWYKPDAIVIPKWDTHKKYILEREKNNYDGGATSDDHAQVIQHSTVIKKWHTDHGVPMFESVDEATSNLASKII